MARACSQNPSDCSWATQASPQVLLIEPMWSMSPDWSRKSTAALTRRWAAPTTVAARATSQAEEMTARGPRSSGPKRRLARARAASTASAYIGVMTADSRSQVAKGSLVRSIAPTAPRNEITQNPSANASTAARETTVNHGTADEDGSSASPVDALIRWMDRVAM